MFSNGATKIEKIVGSFTKIVDDLQKASEQCEDEAVKLTEQVSNLEMKKVTILKASLKAQKLIANLNKLFI